MCNQTGCSPEMCSPDACEPVDHGRGHFLHQGYWRAKFHAWKQPPKPPEMTPPVARFHPVPARPAFEIPPTDYGPVLEPIPIPVPGPNSAPLSR